MRSPVRSTAKVRVAVRRKFDAWPFFWLAALLALMIMLVTRAARADAQVNVDVSRIGDATHIEFTGASEWKYDLKRESGKHAATLLVPALKPEAIAKLRSLSDSLVKSVKVNEQAVDGKTEVTFGVANNSDYFDYISDQPSRLILDFFPKEAAKVDKTAAKSIPVARVEPLPAKKVAVTQERTPASDEDGDDDEDTEVAPSRIPAADGVLVARGTLPAAPSLAEEISSKKDFSHGIFDGGDPEFRRFSVRDYEVKEEAIIASKANFYLPFPILELGTPQLKALISVPPTYEVVATETRENKEARVLLKFFAEKKRALFLKTADEFLTDHPNSTYEEIIRYMIADAHYDIWRASSSNQDFEIAMNNYLALSEKYPDSPMAPRTLLLMGYSYLDRGDSFGALKAFQRFTRLHPTSKHIDRVKISIADSYLKLNRFADAYQMFDDIEKTGTTAHGREEAAYRKGDTFFRSKDYASALREYKGAMERFPAAASRFPNAYYNSAESQFIQGKYRDSLESYRIFLQKFPDHDHGGYAMTRMGELLDIFGVEKRRVQGAFMESYFRYRSTPGAGVARIRLLASRMPEMKEKELGSALHEIEEISVKYANRPGAKKTANVEEPVAEAPTAEGHGEAKPEGEHGGGASVAAHTAHEPEEGGLQLIPKEGEDPTRRKPELPGIEEFSTLLIADGYSARGEYDLATRYLMSYYQKNPQSPNKDKITIRITKNLSEGIRASVDRGDFIDALRRYSKHASGWLKKTPRIDVRFSVGRAYELAGVFKESRAIYEECLSRLNEIKGSAAEKEHNVFETLPKIDAVELRLAVLATKENEFSVAESHLKKISMANQLTEPEQVERAEVAAQVAEARGKPDIARKYLIELVNSWKGDQQLTGPLHLRLAKLENTTRNYKPADVHVAKIIEWKKQEGTRVSDDIHAQALELRGDMFVARGKRADAVKAYRELLEAYETKRPLESVRYRLGQVLYQDGDLKGAEAEWSQLKPAKDNLWQRLAAEQMQGAKWQNEYKKYLNRIPAAAELREPSDSETR